MPLLDHFHPPLRGPRRWEGFHHAWAANIAQHLNREVLPRRVSLPSPRSAWARNLEIDVANVEDQGTGREPSGSGDGNDVWAPPKPLLVFPVDFAPAGCLRSPGLRRPRRGASCERPSSWSARPTKTVPAAGEPSPPSAPVISNKRFRRSSSMWSRSGPPTCTRICWKHWKVAGSGMGIADAAVRGSLPSGSGADQAAHRSLAGSACHRTVVAGAAALAGVWNCRSRCS